MVRRGTWRAIAPALLLAVAVSGPAARGEGWSPLVRVQESLPVPAQESASPNRTPAAAWVRVPGRAEARLLTAWSRGNIALAISENGGTSWSAVASPSVERITSEPKTLRLGTPALAARADGLVIMLAVADAKVVVAAESRDGGTRWSPWQPVAPAPRRQIAPRVTCLDDGSFVAVWCEVPQMLALGTFAEDVVFATRKSQGSDWTAAKSLRQPQQQSRGKAVMQVWNADVVATKGGWTAAWEETAVAQGALRHSEIWVRASDYDSTRVTSSAVTARNHRPRLLRTDSEGIVLAWQTYDAPKDGATTAPVTADADIAACAIAADGRKLGEATIVNANPPSEFGADINVSLGRTARGDAWAAWQSTDSLNGAKGTDDDILAAPLKRSVNSDRVEAGEQLMLNSNATTDSRFDAFDTDVALASWPLGWDGVVPPSEAPSGLVAVWISEDTGAPNAATAQAAGNAVAASRLVR